MITTNQPISHLQISYLHAVHVLFLSLIFFIMVAFKVPNLILSMCTLVFVFISRAHGMPWKTIATRVLLAILISTSYWILAFLYFDPNTAHGNEVCSALRITLMSITSLLLGGIIHFEQAIMYWAQKKWLPTQTALAMQLAIISISGFRKRFAQIRLNAKIRRLTFRQKTMLWYPLLAYAIIHAQKSAQGLKARGAHDSKSKTYFFDYAPTREQQGNMLYWFIVLVLVISIGQLALGSFQLF